MPKAAPSTRSSGHITLSFGLVNIPVDLYSGTVSDHGVERHEYLTLPVMEPATDDQGQPVFDAEGKPVMVQATKEVEKEDGTTETVKVYEDHLIGRGLTNKTTGDLLSPAQRSQIVKKIETEYGPVFVEDNEIEKLFTLDPDTFKITEFQPVHLFHQGTNYVHKKVLYIEPSKSGSGAKKAYMPIAVKLLGTLFKGMIEENVVAVGELTTRGVPKPAILTPDGVLYQVHHTDEIRAQRDLPEADLVDAEVGMMRGLISTMTKTDVADLSDTRSELIQNFADEKAAAGDFTKAADDYTPAAPAEPAFDLMAMLAASVEQAKAS